MSENNTAIITSWSSHWLGEWIRHHQWLRRAKVRNSARGRRARTCTGRWRWPNEHRSNVSHAYWAKGKLWYGNERPGNPSQGQTEIEADLRKLEQQQHWEQGAHVWDNLARLQHAWHRWASRRHKYSRNAQRLYANQCRSDSFHLLLHGIRWKEIQKEGVVGWHEPVPIKACKLPWANFGTDSIAAFVIVKAQGTAAVSISTIFK